MISTVKSGLPDNYMNYVILDIVEFTPHPQSIDQFCVYATLVWNVPILFLYKYH